MKSYDRDKDIKTYLHKRMGGISCIVAFGRDHIHDPVSFLNNKSHYARYALHTLGLLVLACMLCLTVRTPAIAATYTEDTDWASTVWIEDINGNRIEDGSEIDINVLQQGFYLCELSIGGTGTGIGAYNSSGDPIIDTVWEGSHVYDNEGNLLYKRYYIYFNELLVSGESYTIKFNKQLLTPDYPVVYSSSVTVTLIGGSEDGQVDPEPEPEPELEEPDPEPEPEPEIIPEPETESVSDPEPELESEPEPDPDPDPESDPQPEQESDPSDENDDDPDPSLGFVFGGDDNNNDGGDGSDVTNNGDTGEGNTLGDALEDNDLYQVAISSNGSTTSSAPSGNTAAQGSTAAGRFDDVGSTSGTNAITPPMSNAMRNRSVNQDDISYPATMPTNTATTSEATTSPTDTATVSDPETSSTGAEATTTEPATSQTDTANPLQVAESPLAAMADADETLGDINEDSGALSNLSDVYTIASSSDADLDISGISLIWTVIWTSLALAGVFGVIRRFGARRWKGSCASRLSGAPAALWSKFGIGA